MARKLTFDKLPDAVGRILEILTSETSEHTALPELLARVALVESKIDYLQRTVAPDKPVMDMHAVCRVLRLRPKAVNELAMTGVLPSREQGRKRVFFEEGVVRYFMTQGPWRDAVAGGGVSLTADGKVRKKPGRKPRVAAEDGAMAVDTPVIADTSVGAAGVDAGAISGAATADEGRQRVGVDGAAEILGRSLGAVYQLTSTGKIPYYKEGAKVYFFTDELRTWLAVHPPRPRKRRA